MNRKWLQVVITAPEMMTARLSPTQWRRIVNTIQAGRRRDARKKPLRVLCLEQVKRRPMGIAELMVALPEENRDALANSMRHECRMGTVHVSDWRQVPTGPFNRQGYTWTPIWSYGPGKNQPRPARG